LIIDRDTWDLSGTALSDITTETMRAAFARYAETHEARLDSALLIDLERAVHIPSTSRS
jgi:hypothetical protein